LALVLSLPLAPVAMGVEAVPEPEGYRNSDYRAPVPAALTGARTVDAEAAAKLHDEQAAVFIDVYPRAPKPENLPAGTVWRDVPHKSIEGAVWLPNVGYGTLAPAMESRFADALQKLSGGDKSKPLLFFCLKNCWMSWNAGKRALALGYRNVIWFPDGTDAWQELPRNLVDVQPLP
jgi:PQQ-dependent catabolism-associated CXXCW motif protein